jgi:hypothetical protein
MRMWMVDTKIMCRQHLLGEHNEIHKWLGSYNKGISVRGYLEKGLIEPIAIVDRHNELVGEMKRRGYNHRSPLPHFEFIPEILEYKIDKGSALIELIRRCPRCAERYKESCRKRKMAKAS